MYAFSPSQRGFYLRSIHGDQIPDDAVEVSADEHAALIAGQAAGAAIVPGPDGSPALVVPPPPPPPPPLRTLTPFAFRQRLPVATRRAITLAASRALEAGDATLQTWLDDLAATTKVDLDHPEIIAGADALLKQGLITTAQRTALLADVTPDQA